MRVRVVRIFPVFVGLAAFSACAENRLHTYIVAEAASNSGTRGQGIELHASPLKLTLTAPDADDLDNLAEDLRLTSASKYHRLPPLTLLRFDFENKTALPWKFNLSRAQFREVGGERVFKVVPAKDYRNRFTSVAYEHFSYEAMYACYITVRGNEKPRGDFWFDKRPPGEAVELRQNEAGFQVLPFEFMGAGVGRLVLEFPVDENTLKQIPVALVTERGK
ncbi:hypothetical protein [Turneriella parva]|uniref:Lipoprotein n=1 Tax=Turneriella parva (strain ATCC BAA-1111 / DSM 21527 / NCTC 11395 / H) TaxID=869212 RepID=I4BBN8_TURPD|nr:hypothetical protein [Turneriella parva]AFM14695.1 hypothetical protein Turpa_4061 [Turneriella parva DSM 21527]